jgi:hypothetical protein
LLLAQQIQNVAGLGDVRKINFGLDFAAGLGPRRALRPGRMSFASFAKLRAHFFRFVFFQRTGVRLLLGDSDFGKHIEDRLAFDFQFSG